MYRCIANLEIDLEGLSEFYSDVSEYETLNMYQKYLLGYRMI